MYGKIKKERSAEDASNTGHLESMGVVKMRRQKHSVSGEEIREILSAMAQEKDLKSLKRSDGRYTFTNPFLHGVIMRLVANMGIGGQVRLHYIAFLSILSAATFTSAAFSHHRVTGSTLTSYILPYCTFLNTAAQTFLAATIGINVANMSLWVHGRTTKNLNWQIESSIKSWLASVSPCPCVVTHLRFQRAFSSLHID